MKRANKSRPRHRKTDSGRQQIVEAARAHFFSHGFRSVTMDDLAEELGISKKTLYAYFPGKIELLQRIQETGSITEAARQMGMSYMRAWKLVKTMEI